MTDLMPFIIGALSAFVASYLIIGRFFANEAGKRKQELQRANQKISFPTRMRAYERLTLFVERITPGWAIIGLCTLNYSKVKEYAFSGIFCLFP